MALGADSMAANLQFNNNSNNSNYDDEFYYADASEIASAINRNDAALGYSMDANVQVIDTANSFIANSQNILVGDTWDVIRGDLQTVVDDSEASVAINEMISETQNQCLQRIIDFLAPDYDLNTADLPKYELEKEELENEIAALLAENEKLAEVPARIIISGQGTDDEPYNYDYNPEYDAALQKIDNNNLKMETELQPRLDEVNRLITKINAFNDELLPAIELELTGLEERVRQFSVQVEEKPGWFKSLVDKGIRLGATGLVAVGNATGGVLKAGENLFDGFAWVVGGAVCDIGTWLKFDGMEDAKKDLAGAIAYDCIGSAMDAIYADSAINAASYWAYDSKEMNAIYEISDGVVTTVVEGMLPLPAAIAIGTLHEAGSTAEALYAADPNAQAGLFTGDYSGRIAVSGISGGIKGYLSNNAFQEIGEYRAGINSYNGLGDYLVRRRGDIIGEMAIDFASNVCDDYAANGAVTNLSGDLKRSLGEQTIALGIGVPFGVKGFEITSIGLDLAQGTGIDDMFVEEAKLMGFPFMNVG